MQKKYTWIIAVLFLLVMYELSFADVHTQWDDVEVIVSGETEFVGAAVDPFFTLLDADDVWNYYVSGFVKLGLDIRFTEYSGMYVSMKTPKTTTGKTFGDGIVRAKGVVFGADPVNLMFDEVFFELERLIISEVTLYAGLMHTKIGLDTSEKNWFEGHGQLFMNTEFGRFGENLETEYFPAGIKGVYDTRKGFQVIGGWFFMRKDLDDYNQDVQFSYVYVDYNPSAFSTYMLGASYWQEKGNHFQSYWVGSKQAIDAQFSTYAFAVFHAGDDTSSQAYYAAIRYISGNKIYFIDVSFWYLGGNNPASSTEESFFNSATLTTTMILDDANTGIGLNDNYSAVKIVTAARFSYSTKLLVVLGYYDRLYSGSGPKPGNEIDAIYRVTYSERFSMDIKAGYLFDSEIVPENKDAWMIAVCVKAKY